MGERRFEPDEVEALVPALTGIMEGLMKAHAEAEAIRERLRAEQQRVALGGGGVIDQAQWRADRAELERLTERLQGGLNEILALGGVVKDLELGLVDFPHLRQGRVVNLCWRYGERKIRFWHGLDEGYAGRKPL